MAFHLFQLSNSRHSAIGPTIKNWEGGPARYKGKKLQSNVTQECGWGRLLFAHTFHSPAAVVSELVKERKGARDIAFYLRDPHVVLALKPQKFFLDPSHSYRLWLTDSHIIKGQQDGFVVVSIQSESDIAALNRIYASRKMVKVDPNFLRQHRRTKELTYLVAKDQSTKEVIGVAMAIDHCQVFQDPERGSSIWSLAVDPQTSHPGVGEALIRELVIRMKKRGCCYVDLSVLHDNHEAIALYEKLGFQRIPVFTIKNRNPINEKLFTGPSPDPNLNPYATIIVNEARRRGIDVDVLDAENGYFRLSFGGRKITCRESLSELTSAIAMSRCADKKLTLHILKRAGLTVPHQMEVASRKENGKFLRQCGAIVVKPACGEQGAGISVEVRTAREMEKAISHAAKFGDRVLLEQYVKGEDLRIIVINYHVVAAAIRRPARVVGTGKHSIGQLVERQSQRRSRATGGESFIPLDSETRRCIKQKGYDLGDTLPRGKILSVRKTANLHTGGTLHDVTQRLHPDLALAAIASAKALEIPVVGFDFIVPSCSKPEYVIIEANERPGLANHEPQPTVERFLDLLFPQTIVRNISG